jgi:hypothetical protein
MEFDRANLAIVDVFKYWLKSENKETQTLHKGLPVFFGSVSRAAQP